MLCSNMSSVPDALCQAQKLQVHTERMPSDTHKAVEGEHVQHTEAREVVLVGIVCVYEVHVGVVVSLHRWIQASAISGERQQ